MSRTLNTDLEQLKLLDAKRPVIVDAMAKIGSRFVAQVGQELPERWEQIVRLFITDRPYEAKAQGSEGLSRLKAELQQLQSRAHVVAAEHLSGPKIWNHEQGDSDDNDNRAGVAHPAPPHESLQRSRVSNALGRAEAEVLSLLRPIFGEEGPWPKSNQSKLSDPLEQIIEAYDRLSSQLQELEAERSKLSRLIASQEAQVLWENA